MKKRIFLALLSVFVLLSASVPALGAASLSNFSKSRAYRGEFSDVPLSAWFYTSVRGAYEYGIFDGKDRSIFDPNGTLTIAETVKIAAILHKCYHTGETDFESASPWYAPYVEYALENDIPIGAYRNLSVAATRSDFASIIAGAMPEEAITPINRVTDGSIPDVFESYSYGQAVYMLYRAGVLTGSDDNGAFYPGRTLTRAEASAIVLRIVDAGARKQFSLSTELTAEQIYKKASPAVFYIEIMDDDGRGLKAGSGFFISETGIAITNYHVIIGAKKARVTTDDGKVYDVAGVYDYDWKMDAALIQVKGEGFPFLELADSSKLLTGATVYALGSPLGLQASFSRGIVSQASRELDGNEFIQLDAAISSGSSGGALLNSSGMVVGVTSASMLGAQNINLAVPISFFSELSNESFAPLESILIPTPYYVSHYPAPDFGAFFDVYPFSIDPSFGEVTYSYKLSDLQGDADSIIDEYTHLVEQNLFDQSGYLTRKGTTYTRYYNPIHDVLLMFGKDVVKKQECFIVIVN
ncbi:MAG: trypsin-like peptidase domain-containing protein [Oscillospiraceae bacterium]|nr:trypsin-like peptidase domain-containing protein [Oscillospiraceae bacterium]